MGRDLDQALDELCGRYGLDEEQRRRLALLVQGIADNPNAPTTVRDPLAIVDRHLADSLVALELAAVSGPQVGEAVDVGSGAGIPGLPLAAALPTAGLVLLESNGRKCAFMERLADACAIENVTVVNGRAESWEAGRSRFELVTARALAPFPVVVEYAAPLLRLGGHLVVWRGRRDAAAEAAAEAAAVQVGLAGHSVVKVQPFTGAADHHLHLMSKVIETPSRFPRRPGAALKRPLAGDRPGSAVV